MLNSCINILFLPWYQYIAIKNNIFFSCPSHLAIQSILIGFYIILRLAYNEVIGSGVFTLGNYVYNGHMWH